MISDPVENLYLYFDLCLDPAITKPDRLIEYLNSKISEWNKKVNNDVKYSVFVDFAKLWVKAIDTGNGVTLSEAEKAKLKLTSDSVSVLFLCQKANEAKQIRITQLKQAIAEVERDGVLEQQEYDFLVSEFCKKNEYFSESTIKQNLHLTITASKPKEKKGIPKKPELHPGAKEISKSDMDNLENNLTVYSSDNGVNGSDLFTLFGFGRQTPVANLLQKMDELRYIYQNTTKKTVSIDALGKIVDYAQRFFKTEESKLDYIRALERRRFDVLCESKFKFRAVGNSVAEEDYRLSLDEARQTGLSPEWAEWYVYDYYCNRRKCDFPLSSSQPVDERVQCPNCFKLNSPETMTCSCGNPLKTKCPRCGQNISTLDKVCQCGFAVGNMSNALRQIENARSQLATGQLADAQESLRQSEIWWPGNPDAQALLKAIRQREEEKEKQRRRIADIETKIQEQIQKRRYYQAQKQLAELRAVAPDSSFLVQEGKRIEKILSETNVKIKKLTAVSDPVQKMALCEEILSEVADCAEAQAIINTIPILPPREFKAEVTPTGIVLTWKESLSKLKTGYMIVRKENGAPAAIKDGTALVDHLNNTNYTDSTGIPGVIYGYSIFTKREGGAESVACSSELVQIKSEVSQIRTLPGNQSVILGWTKIPNAKGMVITRWEGDTPSGKGTVMRLANVNGHVDSGLENGVQYTYQIQTLYQNEKGKDVLTAGLYVSIAPRMPPKAVRDLEVKQFSDNTLQFHWTPVPKGEQYLFSPKESQAANEGKADFVTLEALIEKFGKYVPLTDKTSGTLNLKIDTLGVRRFFVMNCLDGVAVYGNTVEIAMINEVSKLQMETVGTEMLFSWTWPAGIETVIIQIRRDAPSTGPNDPKGTKKTLTLKEYNVKKAFVCNQSYKNCYFTVYSYIPGSSTCSGGVTLFAGKICFRYDMVIEKSAKTRKPEAKLVFTTESDGGILPAMIVRKDYERPPLNRNFGEILMEIPAVRKSENTVVLPVTRFNENAYVKVFVADKSEEQLYSIDGPPFEELKLEYIPRGFFQRFFGFFARIFHR